jgi:hypothetical protein
MHRIADVAVAVLAAALVLAAPSAARADSSGATRFDFHYCSPDGTFCSDGTTLQNFATMPSGHMVLTYHSQYSNTFSGFGCTGQTQEREHDDLSADPRRDRRVPLHEQGADHRRMFRRHQHDVPLCTCSHSQTTRFAPSNQRWTALRRRQSSPPLDAVSRVVVLAVSQIASLNGHRSGHSDRCRSGRAASALAGHPA